MIWATVSSRSCFYWLYRASPSLVAKNIINLISVLTIWWCPCVQSSLVVLAVTSVFSWQNSINSLCPASFCTPRPICLLLQVFLDFLLFQSPIMKRTSILGVSSMSCRFIQLFNFSFFSITGQGVDLDYWYWMVCLGNKQRSFCRFSDCIQVLHFRLFCWLLGLLHFF